MGQGNEDLSRLAREAGIEPHYWDIQGRLHETSADTARALLSALGLPAATDAQVVASLEQLTEERWRVSLPNVLIARENEEILVPLCLPLGLGSKMLRWTVLLEDGERRAGECDLTALPVEGTGSSRGSPIVLRHIKLPALPTGYHDLRLDYSRQAICRLIVAPARCYLRTEPPGWRHWGVAAQLYAMNSSKNWGIGDFGDLQELIDRTALHGADAIGLNPLHALFLDAPAEASPYAPNSRLFRNPLYLAVTAIPDLEESSAARALIATPDIADAISAMRAGPLVDYWAVAELKLAVLACLHRSFRMNHLFPATARGQAFMKFLERSGADLQRFATFQMLCEHFGSHDWRSWPSSYQDCRSGNVAEIQRREADRISFFTYLQWLCEEQLSSAAETARKHGMTIGLYNDLAVGVNATSADHWAQQDLFAGGLSIGAPPDPFNERGQEWGVVPLNPRRLKAAHYEHFIAILRANMRNAGALRTDHIMGWQRLFLIPAGAAPANGAYVRFPLNDLLAIAALESWRNRCLVIGEDLGTVPEGFREQMAATNILSCRIFYFEREHGGFCRPSDYPVLASVSASTHDLPTLRGFWTGDDIAAKLRLGTYDSAEGEKDARAARSADKRALLQALADEGLLPDGLAPSEADDLDWTPDIARAVHLYLARTPSLLLMTQLDDLASELHQANLPGSTTEYPNWRRRLSRLTGDLLKDSAAQEQMDALTLARRNTQHSQRP